MNLMIILISGQVFIMSLGEFGDLWDAIDGTKYIMIGECVYLVFVFVIDYRKYILMACQAKLSVFLLM